MNKLKEAVFQHYPWEAVETEKEAWEDCARANDEAGRKLKD